MKAARIILNCYFDEDWSDDELARLALDTAGHLVAECENPVRVAGYYEPMNND